MELGQGANLAGGRQRSWIGKRRPFAICIKVAVGLSAAVFVLAVSALALRLRHIALVCAVGGALGSLPASGRAAGLECPELGRPGEVRALLTALGVRLVASGNSIDLANEIDDLVNKLQIDKPNIPYDELTDVLIAAYCPVVAGLPNLSDSEKWRRMRQFDTILQQQLAAIMATPGTVIVARVPLPPAVYRELRSQAASSGQTPAQLMAAILSRAAGQ